MKKPGPKTPPTDDLAALWPGQSTDLLKELHILTRDGKLNSDSRRKLKQVLHLFQLIKPALESIVNERGRVTIVDVGAGKNYLGFILYDLFVRHHPESRVISIESRPELVQKSAELAKRFGFQQMEFIESRIDQTLADSRLQGADILTALHCCDTATDDAIRLGLKIEAKFFALVPCCQAEIAHKLKAIGPQHPLYEFWAHPIHAREFGSHVSNVLRGLVLESKGYKVRVTELVGWEHSMKNEFIYAERIQHANRAAQQKLEAFIERLPVEAYLLTPESSLG